MRRRDFLAGMATAGAGALLAGGLTAQGQGPDLRDLQASGVLTAPDRQSIERGNAARLVAGAKT